MKDRFPIDYEKGLTLLGRFYDALNGPPLDLAICGGSALLIQKLIPERVTIDIDIISPLHLPPEFTEAVTRATIELNYPEVWIDYRTQAYLKTGLPEGFYERALKRQYGKSLTLLMAARYDLIFFKLDASVGCAGSSPDNLRHIQDLKNLNPTDQELTDAALWCLEQDSSEVNKGQLFDFIRRILKKPHVAEKLETI